MTFVTSSYMDSILHNALPTTIVNLIYVDNELAINAFLAGIPLPYTRVLGLLYSSLLCDVDVGN